MDHARRLREIGRQRGRYQSKFVRRHEPKTRRAKQMHRHCVWESLFMRKSAAEKREIIRKPWELPMAAQHLSAILIQKYVRGMLCRAHLHRDVHWRPPHLQHRHSTKGRHVQSPMQRFIATANGSFEDDQGFRHFAATLIQAWYRKEKLHWCYMLQRSPLYHIAALQIQYTWKTHCEQRRAKYYGVPPRTRAALVLQASWKSYTNRRIFRYYHDLITFRNTGDPAQMLRAINPTEASLLDASMGAHVRFRLGGMSFPPTIYYKIFTKRAVCDLNAFSPKDYTVARQVAPTCHSNQPKHKTKAKSLYIRVGNSYYRAKQAVEDTRNWYKRMENNGWRPVTAKVLAEANNDPIAVATSKRTVESFHHTRLIRRQDVEKQRRLRKREWMHKLYTQGLLKEVPGAAAAAAAHPELRGELLFDVDFDNENWEDDAEDMFQWASALDFDEYQDDWRELGKTASTDDDARLVLPGY